VKVKELYLLINCTVAYLEHLLQQYNKGNISRDQLQSCSSKKIDFIKCNMEKVQNTVEKQSIEKVLTAYNEIFILNYTP
jgi:hypothetical protein